MSTSIPPNEAKPAANINDSSEDLPLSPIVGYNFDNDDENLSSSEEDPIEEEALKTLNARLAVMTGREIQPEPATPRSEKRKRMRKKLVKSRKKAASEAMMKRQKLFEPLDIQSTKEDIPPVASPQPQEDTVGAVQSARDEEISRVSESSGEDVPEPEPEPKLPEKVVKPLGFQTASGKFVPVSQKALETVRALQSSGEMDGKSNSSSTSTASSHEKEQDEDRMKLTGFKTASGRFVPVSQKALETVRGVSSNDQMPSNSTALFREKDDATLMKPPGLSKPKAKFVPPTQNSFQGLKFPPEEIPETADPFDAFDEFENGQVVPITFDPLNPPGFKTASGKPVVLSKQALSAAEKLFQSVDAAGDQPIVKADPPGFKNVNRNCFPVSHKAVQKAQSLFKGMKPESDIPAKVNSPKTRGFQTAGGKFVPVSQKALHTVRNLKSLAPTPGKFNLYGPKSNVTTGPAVGAETQEVQDCLEAFLADEEDEFLANI